MSKSKTIAEMQEQMKQLRASLASERDTKRWFQIADEINSLSVDIDQTRKKERNKRCKSFIPDRIVIRK